MTKVVAGPLLGTQRTPCQPGGTAGSVNSYNQRPSSGETLTQPALFSLPQSLCQYAPCRAWGPLKFWVQGTSEWMYSPGASIVAVANLPLIGNVPVGVEAVSIGSLPGTGVPPRPGEISVTYTGVLPS